MARFPLIYHRDLMTTVCVDANKSLNLMVSIPVNRRIYSF